MGSAVNSGVIKALLWKLSAPQVSWETSAAAAGGWPDFPARFFSGRRERGGLGIFGGGVGRFRPDCPGAYRAVTNAAMMPLMDRTNAERQRRYIERLKRKADAASRLSASSIAAALVTVQERKRREDQRRRWPPPARLEWTVKDLERLHRLHRRMHDATDWQREAAARKSIMQMHTGYGRGEDDLIELLLEVLGIAS